MRRISLSLCSLLLILTACANQTAPDPEASAPETFPAYSNLIDESTQKEVADRLINAGIAKTKADEFLRWVSDFNSLDLFDLHSGFQQMDSAVFIYNSHGSFQSLRDKWAAEHGADEDLMCRTAAFHLAKAFISFDLTQPSGMQLSTVDKVTLENNPYFKWTEETKNNYYALFGPVEIEDGYTVGQSADAVARSWDEVNIAFTPGAVSLITVWTLKDSPNIVPGHAGVLIEDKAGLLFVEKVNPYFPYQATKFEDRKQLEAYLLDKFASCGVEFGMVFAMENNALIN